MEGIEVLKGEILTSIEVKGDEIIFRTKKGDIYRMYHEQDCCECVVIEDINGNLSNLIGSEVLVAEERISHDIDKEDDDSGYYDESNTWTFYRIATFNETVIIRWWGSSNGYYSESVDFCKIS